MTIRTDSEGSLDGLALTALLRAGGDWLAANAPAVDALNVFPVPDGDTGTNMSLTLKAALQAMEEDAAAGVGPACRALARGALLGARGNSGVILSQWLDGLVEVLAGLETVGGADLALALDRAAQRAYDAVSEPKEGTILTVVRAAAEAARALDGNPEIVLKAALHGAQQALAATPELLPLLKDAGVVDAGGQGIVLILEGSLAALTGRRLDPPSGLGSIDANWLAQAGEDHYADPWGYCTEFVIQAPGLSAGHVREAITSHGGALLVVGSEGLVRVHVHTQDPGAALTVGLGMGTLHRIKIDNMGDQQRVLAAGDGPAAPVAPIVAVVAGEGLARVFRSLGAAAIVSGGQSMNPSTQEMAAAARSVAATEVILLPNNPNVIPAAKRVAEAAGKPVKVICTTTVPEGIAALLAYNPELDIEHNADAMVAQTKGIHTVEVTRAVRDATVEGLQVKQGQFLGLVAGRPVGCGSTAGQALDNALDSLDLAAGYLVTLYHGDGVTGDEAEVLARALGERPDTPQVEVVWGGQPHYPYIASVEA